MKKTYKSITTFIVLLCFVTLKLGAQLSGTVTVNSGVATGGTNYQTFTALAGTLNTSGINGPLTVNVVSATGPYNEQPIFNTIAGVSSTNTITVLGNGNVLSFNSTNFAQPFTILLNGTDRMNFYNLNVQALGTTYAFGCMLTNGADYNSFTNCMFSTPLNATSSSHVPFAITSSSTSASGGINSGNYNSVLSCTTMSGYYGVFIYGLTSAPYQTNNRVMNTLVQDFYQSGIYCSYSKNITVKGNIIERPARLNSTTVYGIAAWYNQGALIEGNKIQRIFDAQMTSTSAFYGIYAYYNSVGGGANRNKIINNIISDIKHNGTIYGLYVYYLDGDIDHNTISIDHPTSTSGSIVYGIYPYGGSGYFNNVRNNIVSITRGGTGTKYCNYIALTGNIYCNYNNYYINAPAGTNYVGFYGANATNLAAMQATGVDANSFSVDPAYTNTLALNYIPTSTVINNAAYPVGVITDIANLTRSGSTPDIGAHEFLSNNCSAVPTASSLLTPTYALCPGETANLMLSNFTSDIGINYQWVFSTTSQVGPWTTVPGATSVLYTTPGNTATIYYGVAMNCINASGSNTVTGVINVAGVTTSVVPYLENFDAIPSANKLPNCSWSASNLGGTCLTYTTTNTNGRVPRSGTSYASFQYLPAGANYFYTNGIQLIAGVTYSASLWYQTEAIGYNNWTDLSIMYGTTQTTTGLVSIASSNGPAVSNIYKSLSNTFTVPSTGIYYIAIRGTATSGSAQYLTWDDLEIIIPCTPTLNTPTVALTTNTTSICNGDQVVLSASGADMYSWSTGSNSSMINETPSINTLYTVVGTSTLSSCSATMMQMVTVNPSPQISVYANNPIICLGQSANLTALSANQVSSYVWSNNLTSANISVSPTVTTIYSVSATNNFGCVGTAVKEVSVRALPNITAISSQPNNMCVGEMQTLTALGGVTYQWNVSGSGAILVGNPVTINPTSTTVYTVVGIDANGCSNKSTVTQNVSECVGLKENTLNGVNVYPNPTSGVITIELNNASEKTIQVLDVTGRIISTSTNSLESVNVDLSNLSSGIYYVKIQSNTSAEVIKVVKQ